ncbi:MAG: radical SAM protein [Candidatus Omnitrophica bacterium]|nr:radical SAM protein [Candidatus Omnitrophota bacterium]
MKVVLVEKTSDKNINKDQMGGYGINTQVGDSFFARWIMRQKKNLRNVPLLSLGYLASIFSEAGHGVKVVDNEPLPPADLFIIASSIVDYRSELNTAAGIKKKFPSAKVGFIGPFAGYLADDYLRAGDFIIKGEPENAAKEISKGRIPKGIVDSRPVENLDELSFPNWDFFNIDNYLYYPTIQKKPFLSIQSSRGCSFLCKYCPYTVYQGKWRTRSTRNIIDEIKYMKDRFKIKGLLFRDPIFTLDKDRAARIAEGIASSSGGIEWACETRTDMLDEKLVDRMYSAGLRAINFGIESAKQDLLSKASRKAVDTDYQEHIIRYCEKKGIKVIAFYLLGLPDDTFSTINETVNYAKKLNTFLAQFHILTPFPGTDFYNTFKERIVEKDWEKFNSFTPTMNLGKLSREELKVLKERAFVTYYFRPHYIVTHLKGLMPLWRKLLPF